MSKIKATITIFASAIAMFLFMPYKDVNAQSICCTCVDFGAGTSRDEWFQGDNSTSSVIRNHLDAEFNAQEIWMISVFFEDNILPAMMLMTEQLTVVAMSQVQIFGSFLDAKQQMETQRLLQELQARAHKDYHPSIGMCEFGSSVKSLAASERKAEVNALVLSQRSQDRQLGSTYTSASYGTGLDKESRLQFFKDVYCNPRDQNNGLWLMCRNTATPGATAGSALVRNRMNLDIDYGRLIDSAWTLEADFTDADLRQDERHIMALAANLYAHDVFTRVPPSLLNEPTDDRINETMTDMQKAYMDMRSIVAKRSVAENSYNAIVGMKMSGTEGSRDYLEALLRELGIDTTDEFTEYFGNRAQDQNPSYYAQMEVLTKKIYQNPDFYTNLYDKPANVARKNVALQAIGLMQKFDMFKSYLRSEATLSVLLELAVIDLQERVENEISTIDGTSQPLPAP